MKRILNLQLIILVSASTIILSSSCSSAKEITTVTPNEITKAINDNRWKFFADNAMPTYGRTRNLTSEYFVSISKNKLVVALPYFGRVNSPAGTLGGNPLDFESTSFNLSKETRSDGGWTVNIKNPDAEVQVMTFIFFDNGTAQLNITMTNRSGISYTGKVTPFAS